MICIIPIRSKSKGVKNKNIKDLNGKPLVVHSIIAAKTSNIFEKIIIATDSDYYIDFLKKKIKDLKISKENIFFYKRSKRSSTDIAPTEIVIFEILQKFKYSKYTYLIQATSPFLKSTDIIKSFKKLKKKNFDTMFSAYAFKKFLWKKKKILKPLNYNLFKRPMRQNIDKYYIENGAFYAFNNQKFLTKKNRLFGKIGCYEMSFVDSLDIDTNDDFLTAEKIIKNEKK